MTKNLRCLRENPSVFCICSTRRPAVHTIMSTSLTHPEDSAVVIKSTYLITLLLKNGKLSKPVQLVSETF